MRSAVASTYRIQLRASFGFRQATEIVEYLDALGVSHAYASPYLRSERGSTHGYDLVDPSQINEELGGDEGFDAWAESLRSHGMGHIADFVPNHMGIGSGENGWWEDVLENGESSIFADRFDIEWHPPKRGLEGRVLLPILAAQYGRTLERGELTVIRDGGTFFVCFGERRLPISLPTLVPVIQKAVAALALPTTEADGQEARASPPPQGTCRRVTKRRPIGEWSDRARRRSSRGGSRNSVKIVHGSRMRLMGSWRS